MSRRPGVTRYCNWKNFTGTLRGIFKEGPFSLSFWDRTDSVSFHWEKGSTTPEINLVVDMIVECERRKILLNHSWQVSNLRCDQAVDLLYPEPFKYCNNWTFMDVRIRDVKRIGHSGKDARSDGIIDGGFKRHSVMSAATNDEADEVQSEKQSDPATLPVVKPEPVESADDQVGRKSSLSVVECESSGQPPLKRQKIGQSSTAVVQIGVNAAAADVVVLSSPTKFVAMDNDQSDDDQLMQVETSVRHLSNWAQTVVAKVTKLRKMRKEIRQLTSRLSEVQRKLDIDAQAELKLTEKTAELSQLQLKCDRLELEHKTEIAGFRTQLSCQSERFHQINGELKLKSEALQKLQAELKIEAEQLQKESETVQLQKSELKENTANMRRLTSEVSRLTSEVSRLTSEVSNQQQLNDRKSAENNRLLILIEKKIKLEEDLLSQLDEIRNERHEEVRRLSSMLDQRLMNKANLPPVYPGWTVDFHDSNLISSDNFTFPVCRGVLSLKSAVFNADFSTESAKKDGRVKAKFSGDAMVELLNFLYKRNFTSNLPTVALELYSAAEHYQLKVEKLKKLVEVGRMG